VARFPRNVVLLAATSFLADVSGEMLQAVLPFVLLAQGATGLGVGITGAADAVGHVLKPLFGIVSDRLRKRKPLIVGGYVLPAFARMGIAAAPIWWLTTLLRGADRVGKGMRTSPRDALLAESGERAQRGRTFGLHRAADTGGAVVGVALALAGIALWGWSERAIVLAGAFIALGTLAPLAFVRDVEATARGGGKSVFEPASPRYRAYLLAAAVLAAGQVSYLFFILRASDHVGGPVVAVALYLLFNVVYAALAYPLGLMSDRLGKPFLIAAGALLFSAACALMILSPSLGSALAGFAVLGLAFAATEGVQRAYAADLAGSDARSTRLGWYHATVGMATVVGGVATGLLWDRAGEAAAFAWGAVVPLLALALLAGMGFLRRPAAAL